MSATEHPSLIRLAALAFANREAEARKIEDLFRFAAREGLDSTAVAVLFKRGGYHRCAAERFAKDYRRFLFVENLEGAGK